jgi:hypothetical protein
MGCYFDSRDFDEEPSHRDGASLRESRDAYIDLDVYRRAVRGA